VRLRADLYASDTMPRPWEPGPSRPNARPSGRGGVRRLQRVLALGAFGAAAFGLSHAVLSIRLDRSRVAQAPDVHAPMAEPGPQVVPQSEPTDDRQAAEDVTRRVGILAGHWQYDTGAVCEDGLREVDVTLDVALRTKALLEAAGLEVDVLPEHDPDVPAEPVLGYRAAALVAIHADSCEVAGASGFKVARWVGSSTAEDDDSLVACLESEYARASLLPRHDDSITTNMTHYYALREVSASTPGAIIELGFLLEDRAFLEDHRYEAAQGVAGGILCFLAAGEGS
jgi:N-acetylmuramoyl-L-alanine amidase